MITYTDGSANGFRTGMAVIFIAGEMAGIGMLAAPWAVVNLGKSMMIKHHLQFIFITSFLVCTNKII